jgi:hypothetical protein
LVKRPCNWVLAARKIWIITHLWHYVQLMTPCCRYHWHLPTQSLQGATITRRHKRALECKARNQEHSRGNWDSRDVKEQHRWLDL